MQSVLMLGLFGALGLWCRSFIGARFPAEVLLLHDFETQFAIGFVTCLGVLGVFTVWTARMLVVPVERLMRQAKSVLDSEGLTHPNVETAKDPDGEWNEIGTSIETIRQDLRAKTERLEAQREELATMMSAITEAILAVDREGRPMLYNSRLVLLFGSEERVRGRRVDELFTHPEILAAFRDALDEGKAGSVRSISFEQDGGKRFFSVSVAPLRRGGDVVYGAVGVFHDITDLKRAEQIRIDFVANVSHELRTPLTSIKGYADTLMLDIQDGRPPSSETKDFLEVISRNADRLMSLINDLLDLSALESTDVIQRSRIPTEEFTLRILRQMQGTFDAKKHLVTAHYFQPVVYADPKRLEQVLVNLLENAAKYSPPGGSISVSWIIPDGPNGERRDAILRVTDTGPGIPPEHHPRLFERFYRVDKARSRDQGGTGLGLAIVKHIMQRHDGAVWVESVPGQGATFICRFPHED